MTEKSFTFFEIHLHDGLSFSATNTAPAIGGSSEPDPEESSNGVDDEATESTSGGPFGGGAGLPVAGLVALVLLVALAAVAKHLRGDDDALSELDDVGEE
ncbi:hypothetical protein [Halobellus rufus]|uniref:hypothetical protein n=1 Tax=Halobellus rufus TaxID=1448860 RepID=UPI000678F0DF|nr:hypothetical protein [Halobellus rufus]